RDAAWSATQPCTDACTCRGCDAAGTACLDISGANGASYGLAPDDARHTLRVVVTARNARGAATAISAQTGLVVAGQVLDVAQISLPNTLVIDAVRFSPNPLRSRLTPIVARFHVSDA